MSASCSSLMFAFAVESIDFLRDSLQELNLEHVLEPVIGEFTVQQWCCSLLVAYLSTVCTECPPKWSLFTQIIKEIRSDYDTKKHTSQEFDVDGRVLVIVKDELAMSQLRDVLFHGSSYVSDQRFRWFVTQQCSFIRKRYTRSKPIRTMKATGTSSSSIVVDDNSSGFELNDRFMNQLLNSEGDSISTTTAAAVSTSSTSTDPISMSGFLDVGMSESDVRALGKEMQLMLLQVTWLVMYIFDLG
jgi:hypothetical protein